MKVLVTGSAGFIGYHVAKALLERGEEVVGFDNFNNYYDPTLKEARNAMLEKEKRFTLVRGDVADREAVDRATKGVNCVCHLAAAAGVRYSMEHPEVYVRSNLIGFHNVLESMRDRKISSLIYASSSSVYGNAKPPFREDQLVKPVSLYGATKVGNEASAHAYHHLYGIHATGLRFFTVYGPWGRPDMALFMFVRKIFEGEPIDVFNRGNHKRDFTYIGDIVVGVLASLDTNAPFKVFNLGRGRSEGLLDFIAIIEKSCGKEARKNFTAKQAGDVDETSADIDLARKELGYVPRTSIEEGIPQFVSWYREYYKS